MWDGKKLNNLSVNVLVVKKFIGNIDRKDKIVHIDGNIKNNRLDNLKVYTHDDPTDMYYIKRNAKLICKGDSRVEDVAQEGLLWFLSSKNKTAAVKRRDEKKRMNNEYVNLVKNGKDLFNDEYENIDNIISSDKELTSVEKFLDFNRIIDLCIDKVNSRHLDMILSLYGIKNGGEKTLEAVGKEFGVTKQRVQQVKVRVIETFRCVVSELCYNMNCDICNIIEL